MRVRLAVSSFFLCWLLAAMLAATGALARGTSEPPVAAVGPLSAPSGAVTVAGSGGGSARTGELPQATEKRAPAPSGNEAAKAGGGSSLTAVTAANAVGIRIASVRLNKRGTVKARRFTLSVTVRDQHKRLVQHAFISLGCPHGSRGIAGCTQSAFSSTGGQTSFQLRLGKRVLAHRLTIALTARTPSSRIRKLISLRVPTTTTRSRK